MPAIPCEQIVNIVDGSDGNMQGIGFRFCRDATLGYQPLRKFLNFGVNPELWKTFDGFESLLCCFRASRCRFDQR